ncbi:MAG TPA: M48 family metallopeptidase [Anaerolineae bacterium]|nr:M48 family metallopeptidase [Anaerolineae bacterium]
MSRTTDDLVRREIFKAEVQRWAARIGVEVKESHLRRMRRKWASASRRGRHWTAFTENGLASSCRISAKVFSDIAHLLDRNGPPRGTDGEGETFASSSVPYPRG